jgi:C4-dicarboxylate-specific signal transduction histidine kinase
MSRLVVEASYIRDECLEQKKALSVYHQQLNQEMGEKKVSNAIKNVLSREKRDHKVEFRQYINGISSLNKNIASVDELIKVASKMTKRALGKIDINKMEEDAHEIYSSKHYIYGELIVRCWRDFLEVKAEEIRQAQLKHVSQSYSMGDDNS